MSIALVVTEGFGNGTLVGTIRDVTLEGYGNGYVPPAPPVKSELFIGYIRARQTITGGEINDDDTIIEGTIFVESSDITFEFFAGSIRDNTVIVSGTINDDDVILDGTI